MRTLLAATVTTLVWIAGVSAQADPFLGIWELDLAKSSITRGAPPQIETVVNTAEPGGFRSLVATVSERATRVEVQHYILDGRFHRTEGTDPRELSFTRVGARAIESDTRRNGEITVKRRIELSPDGRTLTMTASGASGSGQKYANDTRVYEKKS